MPNFGRLLHELGLIGMPNTIVSVSHGAELVRRDRQTLYNHRRQGKLSFVRREDGTFGVDIAELQRAYGKLYMTAAELEENNRSASNSTTSATITHELQLARVELRMLKQANGDLAESRDDWKKQAQANAESVKLLEHDSKERENNWAQSIKDRQLEVQQAREEAAEIQRIANQQAEALEIERKRVAALESRSWWDVLTNKKITIGV